MLEILIFIIGTVVGSFLGVVVERVPNKQSILFPPSHCVFCKHRLSVFDLIPILSYLFLGGKCRYCRKKLSVFYPVIEFITGFLFISAYIINFPDIVMMLIYFLILSILVIIFFADLRYGLIPFPVVLAGIVVSIVYLLLNFTPGLLLTHLLSAFAAFLMFFLLFLGTKGRGMGFGDVVLVTFMGLFLGFPQIVFALYIGFLTGALVSLILILLGRKHFRHDTIPFGPFLVTGAIMTMFFNDQMMQIVRILLPL